MKYLKILISVVLLGVLAWRTDWPHVAEMFAGMHLGWWLAALVVYGVAQVCSALRWQQLSRPLGFSQPLRYFLAFYYIGMFFNLFLPTSVGGDVVRAWYLADGPGRKLPAFVSVFVERCSGLMVLLALAGGATLLCPLQLPAWVPWSVWLTLGAFGIGGIAALIKITRQKKGWRHPAAAAREAPRKTAVLVSSFGILQSSLLRQPSLLVSTTLLSVGVQAANVILLWFVGLALGVPVPAAYYWIVVPMVSLAQVVLPSLNGHGVREGGLILFLAPLGVPASMALALGFLWFAVMATAGLCGGAVYLFGNFSRPEVSDDHDQPVRDYSDQGRTRQPVAAA